MKTRTGFVSNSSSSSFIVAIRKKTSTSIDLVKFIEFVANHTEKTPVWKDIVSVTERQNALREERRELQSDVDFGIKELEFWSNASKNKKFDVWFEEIKSHMREFSPKGTGLRGLRQLREYKKDTIGMGSKPCSLMARWLKLQISQNKERIAQLTKHLESLKDLKDSDWGIYSFEEDLHWSDHKVSRIVDDLVKNDVAKILYKHTA